MVLNYMHTHTQTQSHTHTDMQTHTQHIQTHTHTHTHTQTHAHTHQHTHTHTDTRTHTHTLVPTLQQVGHCVEQVVEELVGILLHVVVKQFCNQTSSKLQYKVCSTVYIDA